MDIIKTDQWLFESYEEPMDICRKLRKYFNDVEASHIYQHLTRHGMYQNSFIGIDRLIKTLRKNKTWKLIHTYSIELKNRWDGPDVPIFILPADPSHQNLKQGIDGKSGLAFKDKVFLFISDHHSENELKALLTHEYNHVCRLNKLAKKESDYVLLDTIILEGLAENAVQSLIGKKYVAPWVNNYTTKEMQKMWRKIVYPNRNLPKNNIKHYNILYGQGFFPTMAGYAVGYYLVDQYIKEIKSKGKDLLNLPSETISQINKTGTN